MNTYKNAAEAAKDKACLVALMDELEIAAPALRRDENGLWVLQGSRGYVSTWGDGKTWNLIVDETSLRRWRFHKKRLDFAELTQDGDEEGAFRLHRMPTEAQATVIREVLGLRRRVEMTPERLELLQRVGFKAPTKKGPFMGIWIDKMDGAVG